MKKVCSLTSLWRAAPKTVRKDWNREVPYCGEDAFFTSKKNGKFFMGIADGVGGWRDVGVDPSEFAWGIMLQSKDQIESQNKEDLLDVLTSAYKEMQIKRLVKAGSSTVSMVSVELGNANILNLGDSGFRLFRDNKMVYKTHEQQYFFNAPYQLSILPDNEKKKSGSLQTQPEASFTDQVKLMDQDVLLLATDGLFDNLDDEKLVAIIKSNDTLESKISKMLEEAIRYSKSTLDTPFSKNALKAGYRFRGGKEDDITILLAQYTESIASKL